MYTVQYIVHQCIYMKKHECMNDRRKNRMTQIPIGIFEIYRLHQLPPGGGGGGGAHQQ